MKNNLTEIIFIIDRSGSMQGLEGDTIGGFNSMLEKQRQEKGSAIISTILFDDKIDVIHDRMDITKIENMNNKQYYVRGCTALLDALGETINRIKTIYKYARKEDIPEKTLFIITTDGMENASKNHSYDEINKLIECQKEKYHWEFLFLGANIDAIKTARMFGIDADRAVNYVSNNVGTVLNYEVMSKVISHVRCCNESLSSDWKSDIEKYHTNSI